MVVAEIIAGTSGIISFVQGLIAEGWTRFFILIIAIATIDNVIGSYAGIYPLKSSFETIIHIIVPDFYFPIYYGVSTLLMMVVLVPFAVFMFKASF